MRSYQKSNLLSRYFYSYVTDTLNNINSKNCEIEVEDIEDMNREDDPTKMKEDKTLLSIANFKRIMQQYVSDYEKKGLKPDYYIILRNSCFWAFLPETKFCVFHALVSESFAVFYSYFVG